MIDRAVKTPTDPMPRPGPVALCDDWLRWDPERIHRYPEPEPAVIPCEDREPAAAFREPVARHRRHPATEIPYYLALGFGVGLACGTVFLALAYMVGR